jgi:putative endonuclease
LASAARALLGKRGAGGYAARMSWHVYLLSCADGTLYCGMTNDLARRLAEHNGEPAAAGARYTRSRRPVRLAACAPCADKPAALRLELAVKKRPRAAKLAYLLEQPGARTPERIGPEGLAPEATRSEELRPEELRPEELQPEKLRPGGLPPEGLQPGALEAGAARQDRDDAERGQTAADAAARSGAPAAKGRAS